MGNRPKIRKVLSVGDYRPDELIARVWGTGHRHEVEHIDYSAALRRALTRDDIILASFERGVRERTLNGLLAKGATSVIWLKDDGEDKDKLNNASLALDLCSKFPNVIDVVGSSPYHSKQFQWRLGQFHCGERLYLITDALQGLPRHRAVKVFPSTPFYDAVRDPFLNAVRAAFGPPFFEILNPGGRNGHGQVPELVCRAIEASDLIVVNTREGGGHGKYTPNVWLEVGYAQGLNRRTPPCPKCKKPEDCPVCRIALAVPEKRFLVCRHIADTEVELPVDMGRPSWITYEDELDLAMQIYWGRKP